MANDGSIRFATEIDNSKAYRELEKLNQKCQKLQNELTKAQSNRDSIIPNLNDTYAKLDDVIEKVKYLKEKVASSSGDQKLMYKEELSDALYEQRELNKEATRLENAYDRAKKKVGSLTEQLDTAQAEAGAVEKKMEMQRLPEALGNAIDGAKKKISGFFKYALGITTVIALFNKLRSAIKESVMAFAERDAETKANIDGLRQSLELLKVSWGAAFAPILNAVTPILQTLIGWLTAAANAVARFLAILGGKTTYKKAISNNNKLADSLGGAGSAAQEAKKQLAGFDELNILNRDSGGGGGGGAGGVADEIATIEEAIDGASFLDRLAISIKDVLFDWDDLTGEQIVEKLIAGFSGLVGAGVGFMIGGVPGAIIGALVGVTLGCIFDTIVFDHDGVLSASELANSLKYVLNGIFGGIIGVAIGGPKGAFLGAAVGMDLTLLVEAIKAEKGEKIGEAIDVISQFLTVFAAGALGLKAGPVGALIGILVGIGLTLVISKVNANWDTVSKEGYKDDVSWFLCGVLGLPSYQEIIAWFENVWTSVSETTNRVWGKIRDFAESWFNDIHTAAQNRWNLIKDAITTPMEMAFNGVKKIIDKIKGLFSNWNITWPHIPMPHFNVSPSGWSLNNLFQGIIPSFSISWYARGGIVNGASLIGAGEDGAEAIVPLERHTEWIDMVADSLLQKLSQRSFADALAEAFINTPMPALAMGAVLPPNAAYASGGGDWANNLLAKVNELQDAVDRLASQPVLVDSKIYLDRRQVGASVTEYQRDMNRAGGR